VNEAFYRPADVHFLKGDCQKAEENLDWVPESSFDELVGEMVQRDLERTRSS